MKKKRLLSLFSIIACCFALLSCGNGSKDEPDNPNKPNNPSEASNEHPLTSKLKGTSWHIDKCTNSDGITMNGQSITDVYFTDQPYNYDVFPPNEELDYLKGDFYIGYINTEYESRWGTNKIAWRLCTEYGNGSYLNTYLLATNSNFRRDYELMAHGYGVKGSIFELSSNYLVVGCDSNLERIYFSPSEWRGGNTSGGGGGISNYYEKPDIGLESYDCYTNSIIAYYRIYNQDEAKVTSAKGYYGTSSASTSVNATVGGSRITVKFSGLKANTTYYIKCTATGKGGSGSSETTRLSTTR